jgi:hypothetical protein
LLIWESTFYLQHTEELPQDHTNKSVKYKFSKVFFDRTNYKIICFVNLYNSTIHFTFINPKCNKRDKIIIYHYRQFVIFLIKPKNNTFPSNCEINAHTCDLPNMLYITTIKN